MEASRGAAKEVGERRGRKAEQGCLKTRLLVSLLDSPSCSWATHWSSKDATSGLALRHHEFHPTSSCNRKMRYREENMQRAEALSFMCYRGRGESSPEAFLERK